MRYVICNNKNIYRKYIGKWYLIKCAEDLYARIYIFYDFFFTFFHDRLSPLESLSFPHGRKSSPLFIILCVSNSNFLFRPFFFPLSHICRDPARYIIHISIETEEHGLVPTLFSRSVRGDITRYTLEKAFRRFAGKIRVSSHVYGIF